MISVTWETRKVRVALIALLLLGKDLREHNHSALVTTQVKSVLEDLVTLGTLVNNKTALSLM